MPFENPTGGDTGASIQERLESFLAAEDSSDQPRQKASNADETNDDDSADIENDGNADPDANADQDDQPDGDEQDDGQETQLSTTELAKLVGVDESLLDVDADGKVIIKTKIDGKDGAAKFDDLIKSYQLQGHIDNKAREVAEQHKALQQRMAEADQAANARIEKLEAMIGLADQELIQEFQSINWQQLRSENPGEYAARMQDFEHRKAKLQQAFGAVAQERDQQKGRQVEQLKALVAEEREKLPTFIPEWKDEAVRTKEQGEIKDWAKKAGFSDNELASMFRSLHVSTMRKAMLYDKLQASKAVVENKVRTAPKLVKPGQGQQATREQKTIRNIKDNIRKSGGKTKDVAAFLLATGKA